MSTDPPSASIFQLDGDDTQLLELDERKCDCLTDARAYARDASVMWSDLSMRIEAGAHTGDTNTWGMARGQTLSVQSDHSHGHQPEFYTVERDGSLAQSGP